MAARYEVKQLAGKYIITWPVNQGEFITAQVDRIKEHRDGRATARVKISAHLIGGRTELHQGQLNLTAVRSRRELATALASRLNREEINWDQVIEDLCREVTEREEETIAAFPLSLVEPAEPTFLAWPVILERLHTLWYGPGESGKTIVALYFALLVQNGLSFLEEPIQQKNVLYCDWEVDREEAERRISFLVRFLQGGTDIKIELPYYRRCILPLVEEASDIAQDIERCNAKLVIIDSAGPACGGDIQSSELAIQYFNALRKICAPTGAASVTLTHVTKGEQRDGKLVRFPIGSVYFREYPRMTWELRPQEKRSEEEINIGFFCQKVNFKKPAPFGLKLVFNENKILVSTTKVEDIITEELAVRQMIIEELKGGPLSAKELAERLGTTPSTIWVKLSKLKSQGKVTNLSWGKWALIAKEIVP